MRDARADRLRAAERALERAERHQAEAIAALRRGDLAAMRQELARRDQIAAVALAAFNGSATTNR